MKESATLSDKEKAVTELIAWGATKKEVAKELNISERTVENYTRAIFKKTGCSKSNELSAWYFCSKYNISFNDSPFKKQQYHEKVHA